MSHCIVVSVMICPCIFIFFLICLLIPFFFFFFFNDTATTEIYTLSLHDALPICVIRIVRRVERRGNGDLERDDLRRECDRRSEEHTSELQSPCNLVCRLLLEKKKKKSLLYSLA